MKSLTRIDRSELGRWWWTVDRWSLAALIVLMAFGIVLVLAAAPSAGARIGLEGFHLANRQILMLPLAILILGAASLMQPRWLRRAALAGFVLSVLLCLLTLVAGPEIKGSTRWLNLGGFSLQPSELLKPCLAIVAAWIFAIGNEEPSFPSFRIAAVFWLVAVIPLLLQPDIGQAFVVTAVWSLQLFLAGLPMAWVGALIAGALVALVFAYLAFDHVSHRINSFFDADAGDRYQVGRSLEAFHNGGLFGRGPGEGTVKDQLPDSHSDFIFAVAGEELGLLACLVIVLLFGFVVLRGFARVRQDQSFFVLLATAGLIAQFGLQAVINMASTLHLMPTKGMTLPFISYGGSSLLALALGMGWALALTRRRGTLGETL